MTISLEEHVARAIFGAAGYRYAWDDGLMDESKASYCAQSRAAIAAVREYEGASHASDMQEAEKLAAYIDAWWSDSDDDAPTPIQRALAFAASIRESERAACEAIARAYDLGTTDGAAIADAIAARKGKGDGK